MNISMIGKPTIARMALAMLCLMLLGWMQGVAAKDVPPKVKLTSPANHTVFAAPATITLETSATDKDGTIKRVQFFSGSKKLATITSPPYTFTWANVKAGKYTLTAVATDNKGAKTTSHEVHIIVDITPAVSLTSPANNASFKAPATIPLVATAKDPDGKIAKVEFFEGANLLATFTIRPYTFTWNNVAAGNYTLTARATDNRGLTTASNAVNITVTSGAAQLYFIYTDQLNTPRVITNQQNQVVWRWDNNDPFGNNTPDEDPDGNGIKFTCNLRFPGQYADHEMGMNYNYFRDYDSSTGRYIQSDPIGLDGGINSYAYARLDPLAKSDPFGLLTPGRHNEITRNAASADCPSAAGGLAYLVMQADFILGTQDPANSFQHAMCAPGQTPAQGAQATQQFIEEQLKTCSLQGLARALHAAQDKYAGGHRGCQTWTGGVPRPSHLLGDAFPGPAAGAAEAETRALIQRFKAMCPCSACQ